MIHQVQQIGVKASDESSSTRIVRADEMYRLVEQLFPICRSITGPGLRQTLSILGQHVPLEVHEVPTGTPVLDWRVPKEWSVRDAYIKDRSGRRIVDFRQSNLHVVNYSTPVQTRMSLADLDPHLHSLPERPDWIPYRTSYYEENWGFCLTHRQRSQLADDLYEVCIDSSLADGSLTYGEVYLPGSSTDEVLLSCHVCHPSLANDNLSAIAVAVQLTKHLETLDRRYSYRLLFIPGTIGAITWLSRNQCSLSRIKHGLVLALLGDGGKLTYKKSRWGDAEIDKAAAHVLRHECDEHDLLEFTPDGYDERQFGSPGFNLPTGRLTRTPHGQYAEYHTSADDLTLVQPASLVDSWEKCVRILDVLENNRSYRNTQPFGEPQLGRRGLYHAIGGKNVDTAGLQQAMLWALNFSDGHHTLLDIAERSRLPFTTIHRAARSLVDKQLLVEVEPHARSAHNGNGFTNGHHRTALFQDRTMSHAHENGSTSVEQNGIPATVQNGSPQILLDEMTLQHKAHRLIPGGCHTYAKGDDQYPESAPPFLVEGHGCRVRDQQGNEYIEYGSGLRSVTLGHAYEPVVEAAAAQMRKGINFVRPSTLEVECAEEFLSCIPTADMAKFAKNGSDATTAAVKLARACTGRDLVAICGNHPFFSVDDWFIGSTEMDAGIPTAVKELTVSFRYNDIKSVRRLFESHRGNIACLILEAATAEEPEPGFLQQVREMCTENGTLLVFDEIITGFRWHLHGAQHVYGVTPDLSTFGKALANGFSLAALAGRREFMERGGLFHCDPRVFLLSTTYGAEGHSLAAALATMRIYKQHDVVGFLYRQGTRLRDGIMQSARDLGIDEHFYIIGRPCNLIYVTTDANKQRSQAYRTLFLQEIIRRGVLAPSFIVNYSHDDAAIDETIDAVADALRVYACALEEGIDRYLEGRPSQPVFRRYN